MICTECQNDDLKDMGVERMSVEEVLAACRSYRCAQCLETDEETQARLSAGSDAAWRKDGGQSAHDWKSLAAGKRSS